MKPTVTLPKTMRLSEHDAKRVLGDGRRIGSGSTLPISAKVSPQPDSLGHIRYAAAIPKRLLKRAVDRNALKRQIREAIRSSPLRNQSVDVIFNLHKALELRVATRRKALRAQLDQQMALLSKKSVPSGCSV